jgi:hypothetical protein
MHETHAALQSQIWTPQNGALWGTASIYNIEILERFTSFNMKTFCALPSRRICMLGMNLTINRHRFLKER